MFSLAVFCVGELFVKEEYKILNQGFFIVSHINIIYNTPCTSQWTFFFFGWTKLFFLYASTNNRPTRAVSGGKTGQYYNV